MIPVFLRGWGCTALAWEARGPEGACPGPPSAPSTRRALHGKDLPAQGPAEPERGQERHHPRPPGHRREDGKHAGVHQLALQGRLLPRWEAWGHCWPRLATGDTGMIRGAGTAGTRGMARGKAVADGRWCHRSDSPAHRHRAPLQALRGAAGGERSRRPRPGPRPLLPAQGRGRLLLLR